MFLQHQDPPVGLWDLNNFITFGNLNLFIVSNNSCIFTSPNTQVQEYQRGGGYKIHLILQCIKDASSKFLLALGTRQLPSAFCLMLSTQSEESGCHSPLKRLGTGLFMYLCRKWFLDAHSLAADKEAPFRLRNIGVGEAVTLQEITALLGTVQDYLQQD